MPEAQGRLTVREQSTPLVERVYARLQRRAYAVDELAVAEGATVVQVRQALEMIGKSFLSSVEFFSLRPGSPPQLPRSVATKVAAQGRARKAGVRTPGTKTKSATKSATKKPTGATAAASTGRIAAKPAKVAAVEHRRTQTKTATSDTSRS